MIVMDVNVLSFHLIDGKRTPETHALKKVDAEWIVPPFWRVEFQSILWKYVRFGGMPAETALELLGQAMTMLSLNEVAPPPDMVLRDALKRGITVYDAQYVSLAGYLGVRCVTEDVPLQKSCADIAISLEDFLEQASEGNVVREPKTAYGSRKRKVKG
ncbi:MAG: type II toxin-antitoxin system VapC family toxin [Kiritimatiellae bacterium]|jgi:predicted nucleic acid-binding protein|nr:type II toxin-antitoxin system VapC family toxin [Kiritimatiellia bacterium]